MLYLRWALIFTLAVVLAWGRMAEKSGVGLPVTVAPPETSSLSVGVPVSAFAASAAQRCLTRVGDLQTLPQGDRAQHHAATLVALDENQSLAFWFAGSREGAADVVVLRSLYDGRRWQPAQPVLSAQALSKLIHRDVRKLGNPVAWRDAEGRVHLAVVNVTLGGWAMSRLAHLRSDDLGLSFNQADDWVTSPWWNVSTLVRHPPQPLPDGTLLLPVYHEFALKRPEILHLSAGGQLLSRWRMAAGPHLLQPAIASDADPMHLIAVMRSGDAARARIHQQESTNGGQTWSAPQPISLPNPDASIAMVSWPKQRAWLMAYNPEQSTRQRLALAMRFWDDPEGEWRPVPGIELAEAVEASYPSLVVRGERIEMIYTRDRREIAHLQFQACPVPVGTEPSGRP
jgi:predicted neuraminidase